MRTNVQGSAANLLTRTDWRTSVTIGSLLLAAAAGSWAVTVSRMQGMDMGPGTDLGTLGWFAVAWALMMAAMMLPSLVPISIAYATVARGATGTAAGARSGVFACGYLLTWMLAGLLAYALVRVIGSIDVQWLAWARGGRYVAGGVIVAAALYELTPVKFACLRHCRNPTLLAGRWRPSASGALLMGLEHGCFCVGSSWALMAVLFAIGIMNVAWMVVVAALVALEKLLPWGGVAVRSTALLIAALGLAVAIVPGHVPGLTIPA